MLQRSQGWGRSGTNSTGLAGQTQTRPWNVSLSVTLGRGIKIKNPKNGNPCLKKSLVMLQKHFLSFLGTKIDFQKSSRTFYSKRCQVSSWRPVLVPRRPRGSGLPDGGPHTRVPPQTHGPRLCFLLFLENSKFTRVPVRCHLPHPIARELCVPDGGAGRNGPPSAGTNSLFSVWSKSPSLVSPSQSFTANEPLSSCKLPARLPSAGRGLGTTTPLAHAHRCVLTGPPWTPMAQPSPRDQPLAEVGMLHRCLAG